MRFVFFVHSLVSDWNHGNAHFLRGVVRELQTRGHEVRTFEPEEGWSRTNLVSEQGEAAIADFRRRFPDLHPTEYELATLDLDAALTGADVVVVHEWTEPALIERIARHRRQAGSYLLLFHDTHHRSVSDRRALAACALEGFDGVLAFGAAVREIYLREGWARRVWTWHEAADTSLFRPLLHSEGKVGDLVWIGNWGDDERTAELHEFLLEPVRQLGLKASAFGVRYPRAAIEALQHAGIRYQGWLANARVPEVFARYHVTLHVPRRPYVQALPGIPTIRVFEALACGIPLICAPWRDCEGLFTPGRDFLVAEDGAAMTRALQAVLAEPELAKALAAHGLATIRARHTCAHRVDELLAICASLEKADPAAALEGR